MTLTSRVRHCSREPDVQKRTDLFSGETGQSTISSMAQVEPPTRPQNRPLAQRTYTQGEMKSLLAASVVSTLTLISLVRHRSRNQDVQKRIDVFSGETGQLTISSVALQCPPGATNASNPLPCYRWPVKPFGDAAIFNEQCVLLPRTL